MRQSVVALLLALLFTACEAPPSRRLSNDDISEAQASEPEPLPEPNPDWAVSGFDGIPWGTSRDLLQKHRGYPFNTTSGPEGMVLLTYQGDSLLTYPTQKVYMISPSGRLTGGGYVIHAQSNCDEILRDVIQLITERYPKLQSIGKRSANACSPATQVMWKDLTSESMIAVVRDAYQGAVQITYLAPDGLEEEISAARERAAQERNRYEQSKERDRSRF